MKTLQEILRTPRPIKEGGRAVDIETTEVFDVVQVGELHAMCESYGTPHTLALSQIIDYQDAVDCGLVDGWRTPDNVPDKEGAYLVAISFYQTEHPIAVKFKSGIWTTSGNVLAWRDLPTLPD